MKNKFILTTLAVLISFPAAVSAQTPFEAYRKKAQSQFNAYRDQKRQEFEEYRRKVNEDFAAYMSKEWVWNDSCEPVEDPKQSVPQVEPVVIPDTEPVELPDLSEIDETDVVAIEVDDIFLPLPAWVFTMEARKDPASLD